MTRSRHIDTARFKRFLLVAACGFAILAPQVAHAQNIPTQVQPGQVEQRFDREMQPKATTDVIIEQEDIVGGPEGQGPSFMLNSVSIEGGTIYSDADIAGITGKFVGQTVSMADLNLLARQLTTRYRNDGYILSRVILPPQKVTDGAVKLQAVEGFVDKVSFSGAWTGGVPVKNKFLVAQLDRIKAMKPLNAYEMERQLLLIDDLPGVTARSVFKPSADTSGASELVIVIEQDEWENSLQFDNRGSRYLGREEVTGVSAKNGVFTDFDRFTGRIVQTLNADELTFMDALYEAQVGDNGGKVLTHVGFSNSKPGGNIKGFGIHGGSRFFSLEGRYPVMRSRRKNLTVRGRLRALHNESDINGLLTSKDNIRTATLGLFYDMVDALDGVSYISASATQGMDLFGASDEGNNRTRNNAEEDFLRFNASATRIQNLPWTHISLYLSASGQYSNDPLLAAEEFGVGGGTYGRAYDAAEISGDKGIAGAVELRYGRDSDWDAINSYQAYGFWDAGKIWNNKALATESGVESLASAGVGVRVNWAHRITTRLEVAKPLTQKIASEGTNGDDMRVFFTINKRF